ncbi:MAG: hypothetical protein M1834_000837 [Cirrosporium novae-zelandiae]|nr:MAG: hypothetical protein M1834_000837 [Cirrosporium novae-zelandiae]
MNFWILYAYMLFLTSSLYLADELPRQRHIKQQFQKRASFTSIPPVLSGHEALLINSIDNNSLSGWSYYYTHGLHVAGTNSTMAKWTLNKWNEFGISASLAEYDVYLNYPVEQKLSLNYPNGSTFKAVLEEDVLSEDETTSYPNRVPTYLGYSASGNITAEYVYVGQGRREDFTRLIQLNISLEGRIALTKYGGPSRGIKVRNAEENGMVGCVIYTDPGSDGIITEANGYEPYPYGPARNPSSVQRGSVMDFATGQGDPTTPGYPSKMNSARTDISYVIPSIPSLPISYMDALPLLTAINDFGSTEEHVNQTNWVGGLNVSYSTGPAGGTTITLINEMKDEIRPIYNVIGIINGTHEDEVIIVGNHWDAWVIGGAADPNSGTAVMIELGKAFGKLLETGWHPRRTIVLASWDCEEYGLVGSTEWVEEYIPWLNTSAVTYLNVDVACSGPVIYLGATPELHTLVAEILKKVIYSGKSETHNETMYNFWFSGEEGEVDILGSGSDYAAFLHNGISSISVGGDSGETDPIYHYHSNYDSYHWMVTFGDPTFNTHRAIGQYMTLLTYHLAQDEILQFDVPYYAAMLQEYYEELQDLITDEGEQLNTSELQAAIKLFTKRAEEVDKEALEAVSAGDLELVDIVNHKFRDFQRGFIAEEGLPDRSYYKHVIFAPGIDLGYDAVTYPGITEAVESGNLTRASLWVKRTAEGIIRAAEILKA